MGVTELFDFGSLEKRKVSVPVLRCIFGCKSLDFLHLVGRKCLNGVGKILKSKL